MRYNTAMATVDIRQAWHVLRQTRAKLAALALPGASGPAPRASRQKQLWSGFSPAEALVQLAPRGGPGRQEAAAAVREALLAHFPAFAASWSSYINEHGWLHDMVRLPADRRRDFEARFQTARLFEIVQAAMNDPQSLLTDPLALMGELGRFGRLEASSWEQHPAAFIMQHVYGMQPKLIAALLAHNRMVPLWALLMVFLMALVTAAMFIVAVVDPHNPAFTNHGSSGAGAAQYIILPAFSLLFFAVGGYLLWDRPRRLREARARLREYSAGDGRPEAPGG